MSNLISKSNFPGKTSVKHLRAAETTPVSYKKIDTAATQNQSHRKFEHHNGNGFTRGSAGENKDASFVGVVHHRAQSLYERARIHFNPLYKQDPASNPNNLIYPTAIMQRIQPTKTNTNTNVAAPAGSGWIPIPTHQEVPPANFALQPGESVITNGEIATRL